jgi:CheY-like chemotaxis protein
MQGGSINVESRLNEGSCFSFKLKYEKCNSTASDLSILNQKKKKESNTLMEGVSVLLVEDNILNQILAKKVLLNWRCKVDLADNGLVAVEKAKNNKYDIILMDIQLPEIDGYEATRIIRTTLPNPQCRVPIVAMTAHAIIGESEKCIQEGMDDYISKPFDENVLHSKIKQLLIDKKVITNGKSGST